MTVVLDEKVQEVFTDGLTVMRKSLVDLTQDTYRKLPRFVLDYLVASLVDPDNPAPGLRKIDKLLREHFIDSGSKEFIKYQIERHGEYHLFGRIQARVDHRRGAQVYWVDIPSLGEDKVRIEPRLLEQYGQALLTTGAWGTAHVVYDPSVAVSRSRIAPYLIVDFTPQQIIRIDLDEYIEKRRAFTTEEWIDLLITTIGFDPGVLDGEEKVVHLCRLIPFVESGVNLIELGPRETGKTYAARSLSSYGHVITGSNVSVATLFYHQVQRRPGLIVSRDVVYFDEIADCDMRGKAEIVNMLKDVMNSGQFSRDGQEFSTQCGVCFVGNIECDTERRAVAGYHRHLFDGLPAEIQSQSAFLDRLHGFIPGWRLGKVSRSRMAKGYGFVADYFSEIMHRLRDRSMGHVWAQSQELSGLTHRNQIAVRKITSGLLKLVHPHRDEITLRADELDWCLDIAVDLRQRVLDQLSVIAPSEFAQLSLKSFLHS